MLESGGSGNVAVQVGCARTRGMNHVHTFPSSCRSTLLGGCWVLEARFCSVSPRFSLHLAQRLEQWLTSGRGGLKGGVEAGWRSQQGAHCDST